MVEAMTGRIGAKSIDGTLISETDVARLHAEEALHAAWQRRAARVVAASSQSADDCRELLAMLGIGGEVIADARRGEASKPVRKRSADAA
jgi:hypothetical protein